MITSQHDRLESWLRHRAAQEADTFVLVTCGVTEATLDVWPGEAMDEPRAFAHHIIDAAQDDADGRAESGQYEVRHVRDGKALASKRFRREALGAGMTGYAGSANELVGQALAHNQAYAEMYQSSLGMMLKQQERQLDRAYSRIAELEKQQHEAARLYAEAMRLLADVEANAGVSEAAAQRQQLLTDKAGKVLDLVMMKATQEAMKPT